MYTVFIMVYALQSQYWVVANEYPSMKECLKTRTQLISNPRVNKIVCKTQAKKPQFSWHPL
jgi:hypothetical protein